MNNRPDLVIDPEILNEMLCAQMCGYAPRTLKNLRLEDDKRVREGGVRKGPPVHRRNGKPVYIRREVLEWIHSRQWTDEEGES